MKTTLLSAMDKPTLLLVAQTMQTRIANSLARRRIDIAQDARLILDAVVIEIKKRENR